MQTTNSDNNGLAIINKTAPYGSTKGQESLDLALALSNFAQAVSLFFIDDGVWQLLNEQVPNSINQKAYFKTFAALEFYDIENIYVCEQSLTARGLTESQLCIPVTLISHSENNQLLATHNQVLVF
ncbi:sulfurtransferase complex subunit TusC [Paraglaciecola sp. L3A3]|uniref:sulfurtransferase complex subunit TusC n=1 Tax=Paraglaciecola sp. L3A3 TaxID=2686358 RepID=UPI00131DF3D9|nr:sulfurtransferase complex subunit TusC [Paraglaciecola sp. L3A3]